jgi:hypothetical protein
MSFHVPALSSGTRRSWQTIRITGTRSGLIVQAMPRQTALDRWGSDTPGDALMRV